MFIESEALTYAIVSELRKLRQEDSVLGQPGKHDEILHQNKANPTPASKKASPSGLFIPRL